MFEIYSYNSNNYEEDELFPEHLRNSPSYYDIHTNPLDLIIDLSTKHYEKINILNLLDLLKKNNEEENSIKLHKLLPLFLLKIEHLSSKKKNLQVSLYFLEFFKLYFIIISFLFYRLFINLFVLEKSIKELNIIKINQKKKQNNFFFKFIFIFLSLIFFKDILIYIFLIIFFL